MLQVVRASAPSDPTSPAVATHDERRDKKKAIMATRKLSTARTLGVYLIGGLGDIATTLVVGSSAIARGLASRTGLVTDLPPFDTLGLVEPGALAFAGVDIRAGTPREAAEHVYRNSRTFSRELLDELLAHSARAMAAYSWEGVTQPTLLAGTIGSDARALGGALLPLYANFAPDRDLFLKLGA